MFLFDVRLPDDDMKIEKLRSLGGLFVKVYILILVYLLVLSTKKKKIAPTGIWAADRLVPIPVATSTTLPRFPH